MCGIAGVLNQQERPPPSVEQLTAMAAALYHRGPDEFGVYQSAQCGLAHARLSIIDLATGQQPLCNADSTKWLVFNGEIFNYLELRDELLALGHTFRTRSDTEVIVHAWEAWGEAAFERFNGQWAIALWDEKKRQLVLSRDRLGVRPLYLCEHDGRLYFASEVKAIFAADANIPRAFDPVGLDETFTFWSIVPPQSVFAGIEELKPGVTRVYERGSFREVLNWEQRYPIDGVGEFKGSLGEATEAVHAALTKATALRMLRADVPVGSYLSGGLDSSYVAALGREAKGDGFETFSLRFADAEYDETEFQHLMAKRLNTTHHEVMVTRDDIAQCFADVIWHTERPILRTAPAPLMLLSRLVQQHGIKVVLTGEGADEMFAGYDIFREAKVRRFWARQPKSSWRPRLLERLYPYLARSPVSQKAMTQAFFGRNLANAALPGFSHDLRWQGASALKRLFGAAQRAAVAGVDVTQRLLASLPADYAKWSMLARDQYLEIRTLLSGYLLSSQGDRMLMASSVEGRFPFLDQEVVALAASLPASYKLHVLDEKHVLKQAARAHVPDEIRNRKKQPYRAPDGIAFTGASVPEWVHERMGEAAVADAGVFEPKAVAQLWNKARARADESQFSNADNMALVGVLSTQVLHQRLVKARPVLRSIELKILVQR